MSRRPLKVLREDFQTRLAQADLAVVFLREGEEGAIRVAERVLEAWKAAGRISGWKDLKILTGETVWVHLHLSGITQYIVMCNIPHLTAENAAAMEVMWA